LYSIKYNIEALSLFFFTRMSTSLRSKMSKTNPRIIKQIIAGYDTEYKNLEYGKNKLVSAQLSISGNLLIEITKRTPYEFDIINTDTREVIASNKLDHIKSLLISASFILKVFEELITVRRWVKYGDFDSLMDKLVGELKSNERLLNNEDLKTKGK